MQLHMLHLVLAKSTKNAKVIKLLKVDHFDLDICSTDLIFCILVDTDISCMKTILYDIELMKIGYCDLYFGQFTPF